MQLLETLNSFLDKRGFNGEILISIANEVILKKGYGFASFEHNVPNTADTVMRIASITKQFTAACILKLYEDGLLDLNDLLMKYIPDFIQADKITIHHLLSNSSGIANFELEMDFYPFTTSDNVAKALIDYIKDKPLLFEPGSKFNYSISGYLVLQYIIEIVSKQDFESYLKKTFLKKLGMLDTGFDFPNRVVRNKASCYKITDGLIECADYIDMRIAGGGGGLYSTVMDLYKWNKSLLTHQILKEETIKKMIEPHIKADEVNSYGYGTIIANSEVNGHDIVKYYHPGGGNGVRSFNTYYPQIEVQVILISNVEDVKTFERVRKGIDQILWK
ncbi:MAG: beta-lactamase family protein [Tenericutes bacterium]|nr:beta-lactamase family protein [Mycoplasmatota bacterium]